MRVHEQDLAVLVLDVGRAAVPFDRVKRVGLGRAEVRFDLHGGLRGGEALGHLRLADVRSGDDLAEVQPAGVFLVCQIPERGGVPLGNHFSCADPGRPDTLASQQARLLADRLCRCEVPCVEPAVGEVRTEPARERLQQIGAQPQPPAVQQLRKALFLLCDRLAGAHPFLAVAALDQG